jgi:hypothetical protein
MLGHCSITFFLYSFWTSQGNIMTQEQDMSEILLNIEEYREKELIDYYVEDLERLAAENEVTVDYYIAEFT